jgi:NAD(P)H dehydrogenase (quinone)
MAVSICIVYHSGYGHTARVADSVADGVRAVGGTHCSVFKAEELQPEAEAWNTLDAAQAIIFGSPTYMGSVSAEMKRFMEATSGRWMELKWADKLAAGFTNSASRNGDKQNTLNSFVTLAAQHGMLWISLGLPPGNNHSGGSENDLNRLGASLGAMAQSNADQGPDVVPPESDLNTARKLGERVAKCALRWNK